MGIHDNVIGRSLTIREDADGKMWVYARAHATLTAKTPYLVYIGYDGYRTHALWDTTLASISAGAGIGVYKPGIPDKAISSDTDGWMQVGGYVADVIVDKTLTSTVGNTWRWVDATITCSTNASLSAPMVDAYAIAYTSASATTTHNMFLMNKWCMGTTT
jgi:hypothetical protein